LLPAAETDAPAAAKAPFYIVQNDIKLSSAEYFILIIIILKIIFVNIFLKKYIKIQASHTASFCQPAQSSILCIDFYLNNLRDMVS
jgi:hypothetical protein